MPHLAYLGQMLGKGGEFTVRIFPKGCVLRIGHTPDRSEFIMATVLWTSVAFYLYFEIAIVALLCLPFIKPAR